MSAWLLFLAALCLAADPPPPRQDPAQPQADSFEAPPGWKSFGKDLWFDPKSKRVALRARVVLRDGALEHLLCLRHTKEHEAILATEAPPRMIHTVLLLTGAEPGRPVQFRPKLEPPTGTPIAVELEWTEEGKAKSSPARQWVKDLKSGKTLEQDWVFAGSALFTDPQSKKTFYAADDGDLITVANFPSAILDLPFTSSADDAERAFVANTPNIPPLGTRVTIFLRPAAKPNSPSPGPPPASP